MAILQIIHMSAKHEQNIWIMCEIRTRKFLIEGGDMFILCHVHVLMCYNVMFHFVYMLQCVITNMLHFMFTCCSVL